MRNSHDYFRLEEGTHTQEIVSAIISKIQLEAMQLYFEKRLMEACMFFMPKGSMSHVAPFERPNGIYEGLRYSMHGQKMVVSSAFRFFQRPENIEPIKSFNQNRRSKKMSADPSGVFRYQELRKSVGRKAGENHFVHSRGFVFSTNSGFTLVGYGLETPSHRPTSQLEVSDISRSQLEIAYLDNDGDVSVIRGIRSHIMRTFKNPAAATFELRQEHKDPDAVAWDSVSTFIKVKTFPPRDFTDAKRLRRIEPVVDQDLGLMVARPFKES